MADPTVPNLDDLIRQNSGSTAPAPTAPATTGNAPAPTGNRTSAPSASSSGGGSNINYQAKNTADKINQQRQAGYLTDAEVQQRGFVPAGTNRVIEKGSLIEWTKDELTDLWHSNGFAMSAKDAAPFLAAANAASGVAPSAVQPNVDTRSVMDLRPGLLGNVNLGATNTIYPDNYQRERIGYTPQVANLVNPRGVSASPAPGMRDLSIDLPKDYEARSAFAPGPNLVTQGFNWNPKGNAVAPPATATEPGQLNIDFSNLAPLGSQQLVPTGYQTAELRGGQNGGTGFYIGNDRQTSPLYAYGYASSGDPVKDAALTANLIEQRQALFDQGFSPQQAWDMLAAHGLSDPGMIAPGGHGVVDTDRGMTDTFRTDEGRGYITGGGRDFGNAFGGESIGTAFAKGGWIKGAIQHPGAFREQAQAAGQSTRSFAEAHKGDSGTTGKRARLALTLMKFEDGGTVVTVKNPMRHHLAQMMQHFDDGGTYQGPTGSNAGYTPGTANYFVNQAPGWDANPGLPTSTNIGSYYGNLRGTVINPPFRQEPFKFIQVTKGAPPVVVANPDYQTADSKQMVRALSSAGVRQHKEGGAVINPTEPVNPAAPADTANPKPTVPPTPQSTDPNAPFYTPPGTLPTDNSFRGGLDQAAQERQSHIYDYRRNMAGVLQQADIAGAPGEQAPVNTNPNVRFTAFNEPNASRQASQYAYYRGAQQEQDALASGNRQAQFNYLYSLGVTPQTAAAYLSPGDAALYLSTYNQNQQNGVQIPYTGGVGTSQIPFNPATLRNVNVWNPSGTQYAQGGTQIIGEPIVGVGLQSGRPLFTAAENGAEGVRFGSQGIHFTPTNQLPQNTLRSAPIIAGTPNASVNVMRSALAGMRKAA